MCYSPRRFITISCFSLAALLFSVAAQACALPEAPASAADGGSCVLAYQGLGAQGGCLSYVKQSDQPPSPGVPPFAITWAIEALPAAPVPVRDAGAIRSLFVPGLLTRDTGPPLSILFASFQI